MADDNLTANLDLTATDHASSVIKSGAQRMRESLKEYERAIKDVRKSEADATADAVKEIQLKTRAQDAWAKLQRAQSAALAEDTVKHNEKIRREAEKTAAVQKKASSEAAAGYGVAGNALLRYGAGFISLSAGIEAARRSFLAYADQSRVLTTLQTNMRLTNVETARWAEQSKKLSAQTGLTTEQLTQSLARYRSQSKQTFAEDIKSHEQLVQAATNSGTSIQDWEKIRSAANRAMRDDITAVPGLVDGWRNTVPAQMVAPFADGLAKITSNLDKAGGKMGPEFAHQLGGAFKAVEGMFATPEEGAKALVEVLAAATDNGTNFGKVMEANFKKLQAGEMDLVQFLAKAQQQAEGQLVNAKGSEGERARARMGLSENAAKVLKLDLRQVGDEADRSRSKVGAIAKETADLAKDPTAAVNRLSSSFGGLAVSAGKSTRRSGRQQLTADLLLF